MNLKHPDNYPVHLKYIVLARYEQLSHAVSLMSNLSHVHIIVASDVPMSDSDDYTVVVQQNFGENYLSLLKKVTYNLLKNNYDIIILVKSLKVRQIMFCLKLNLTVTVKLFFLMACIV